MQSLLGLLKRLITTPNDIEVLHIWQKVNVKRNEWMQVINNMEIQLVDWNRAKNHNKESKVLEKKNVGRKVSYFLLY